MINANPIIRGALFTILNNTLYGDIPIPFYEEYVQPTASRPLAVITQGNMTAQAYVVMLNQTQNEATNIKCNRKDECSIQLQVTTVYPANKGGSKLSEDISNLILARVKNATFGVDLFVYDSEVVSIRNTNYDTDTNRVWITQIVLNYKLTQSK